MSNQRSTGLALLLIGVLVLMGNTMDLLPAEAFWAGLLTYPIGAYLFFMGTRDALERAERRTVRRLNPKLGNSPGQDHAQRQAHHVVNPNAPRSVPDDLPGAEPTPSPQVATQSEPVPNQIEVNAEDEEDEFRVEADVSYPGEMQNPNSIADRLENLVKLHEQ